MTETTPLLSLPYILPSQAQKHVTHNEALRMLDAVLHLRVGIAGLDMPPVSPDEGERHLVGAAPEGAFAGHAGEIAAFQDGAWAFLSPRDGWTLWDAGTQKFLVFHDGAWLEVAPDPQVLPFLGLNATADTTNRLATAAPATLFTHEGAGHQLKINKATAGDTASALFQTAWSGRAELGLAGNDDFSVKVSADGAAWSTAPRIRAADGNVGIGADPTSLKLLVVSSGDASLGNRSTSSASWCGMNLFDHAGSAAASFQYGNPTAVAFTNEFVVATRHGSIPLKFYQGGFAAGNERLRIDASGRIALLNAQVGVGTAAPEVSAQLAVESTTRGFLPPRMTTAQRDAIETPVEGLMIYNLTDHEPQYWNGGAWTGM